MVVDEDVEPWTIYGENDLLSHLNLYTQRLLHSQGWKDFLLYAAVDSEEDLRELVDGMLPQRASAAERKSLFDNIWEWLGVHGRRSGHNQLCRVVGNWEDRERVRKQARKAVVATSEYVIKKFCYPRPVHFRSTTGARVAGILDENQRSNMLRNQRDRWLIKLAEVLRASGAPVCHMAMKTSDPMATLKLSFGTLRYRTLRQRYKTWSKVALWLKCIFQVDWPQGPEQMLDYLSDVARSMSRTFPGEVAAALAVLEKAGGWVPDKRISDMPVWKNAVQSYAADKLVEQGMPSVRKAMQPFVSMIIAWELEVGDENELYFVRLWSFIRLLKTWASLRADDVQGICHQRLSLGAKALRGVLKQTKTTGPGKRVREIAFYISRRCRFVLTTDWISIGVELLGRIKMGRDFLLPRPTNDLQGTTQVMMLYSDMSAVSRHLSAELAKPVWKEGRWQSGGQQLLAPPGHLFHTEHSERHFVVSVAAALGIPKEDRDMCGRWGVLQSQSHDYTHTSREVTLRVQEKVFESLQLESQYDEEELQEKFEQFLTQKGMDPREAAQKAGVPLLDFRRQVEPFDLGEVEADVQVTENLDDSMNAVDLLEESDHETPVEEPKPGQYWVSISKCGFRRLHQMGSSRCQVIPAEVLRWEICTESTEKADKACKWCFGSNVFAADESSSGSSDSDPDTSQSETEDRVTM